MDPSAAARTMNRRRTVTSGHSRRCHRAGREAVGAPGAAARMARNAAGTWGHGNMVGGRRRPSVRARGIDESPAAPWLGTAHTRGAAVLTGAARWASAIGSARRQPFWPQPGRSAPVVEAGAAGRVACGLAKPAMAAGRLVDGEALVVHGVVPAGARPIRRRAHTVREHQGLWWGSGEDLIGALWLRSGSGVAAVASRASGTDPRAHRRGSSRPAG